ncbi:class I adenylate-forming enzyme family protein [Paenibacillus elgii]|uniref:class I adenylate-forming enzyme family protein n=1 Tax=Paenibacillus elgii TaxID=189691 RepID=UPI0013D0A2F8|nr:long-chain fatty acid--CoA ligase [Paenibacillus elgii]
MGKDSMDWLAARSALTPHRTAAINAETGEAWSYAQMNERACGLAGYLEAAGVAPGDRVAVLAQNDLCCWDALFACIKLRAVFVPLNWRLSGSELNAIVSDCKPKALLYHSELAPLARGLSAPITLQAGGVEYEGIIRAAIPLRHLEAERGDEASESCMMIYSGGTTGKPKGVVLSHQSVLWNMLNTIVSWNLTASDVTVTSLPLFHTGGINALCLPILYAGGTVVVSKESRAEPLMELIQRYACTIVLMVPTMYRMMIDLPAFAHAQFPHVHTFLSGGAPCPIAIYEAFESKGLTFKEGYGLTEAGPNNFYMDPRAVVHKRGSVGKPMMLVQVKIVSDNGCEAAVGDVGEIWLRGKHVFQCYWNQPETTQSAFVDGWLRTGDLGRRDQDGFYYIVGRKTDMIITGGENVYPVEVEQLMLEHPAVKEAAVVGIPDPKWGESVVAAVALHPDHGLTDEELRSYCIGKIGKYKIPKRFLFLQELPKTHVGKVDKKRIYQMYQEMNG